MILLVIVAFIILVLFEVPDLVRNKYWSELAVYSLLMFIALVLSILQILDIKVPNPVKDVQYFVRDVLHLSYR